MWGEEQVKVFEELKHALSQEPVLVCFGFGHPTVLVTNASPVALGAVLLKE